MSMVQMMKEKFLCEKFCYEVIKCMYMKIGWGFCGGDTVHGVSGFAGHSTSPNKRLPLATHTFSYFEGVGNQWRSLKKLSGGIYGAKKSD